jgi:hypothetical protein
MATEALDNGGQPESFKLAWPASSSQSHMDPNAEQAVQQRTWQRRGRRPQPEAELVAEIKVLITRQPTYAYRRRWSAPPSATQRARHGVIDPG